MFENLFSGKIKEAKKNRTNMFGNLFSNRPKIEQPQSIWREGVTTPKKTPFTDLLPMSMMSVAKKETPQKPSLLKSAVSGITNLGNMATNEIIDWLQINKQKLEKSIFDRDLEAELYKRYLQKEKLSPQGEKIAKEYDKKQKEYLMNAAIGATEPMKIGSSLIKKLTTVASKERAFKLLKEANVADDIAREYAPIVAKTTKEPAMFDVIKAIEKAQNTTKATKAVGSFDTLATEARKYKSAEEFVKGQNKVFHGGTEFNPNLVDEKGVSVAKNYKDSIPFAGGEKELKAGRSVMNELYLDKNAKVLPFNEIPKDLYRYSKGIEMNTPIDGTGEAIIKYAKQNEYDAIDFRNFGEAEIRVLNPNSLKTKSQLTDIWNKANKKTATGLFNEYNPQNRVGGSFVENTPLTEFGYKPTDEIIVYRGVPKGIKNINDGDWVTTNRQLAKDYAGIGDVISMKVKAKELFAEKGDDALEELVYSKKQLKTATGAEMLSPKISKITETTPLQSTPQISNKLSQEKLFVPLKETTTATQKSQDPVQIVIQALKEAKPIRVNQEAIYSAQKSQQTARIVAMGKKVSGEQGYFAQLGQLKGKMQVAQFEGIRSKITQPVVDNLFDTIEKSTVLTPFDKISAKTGLSRLLGAEGGIVPTKGELKLLNEVFPPEFIKNILEKRPLMQKLWGVAENLLNLPRSMMATLDLSAPLRQGVFLIGRPKQFLPAFKSMFKYVASEKSYLGLMDSIKARPTYKLMRESGLSLTEMGTDLLSREEAFMSNLSEKMPGFGSLAKASNRAYSGFLNKLRADVFDDLVKRAKILDIIDNEKVTKDIAKFVNSATGRGDIGVLSRASTIMNGLFFSPRLMASRLNLLNPAYYISLNPMVRKEAIKSLLSFGAVASTVLGLTKLNDEVSVGADPRSADFGKIKIGNTRFDVLGGFQQYMVLISRLISGQMVSSTTGKEFTLGEGYKPTTRGDIIQRFFQSKTSPVASFIIGLVNGQSTMGENFKISAEIADRFIPMMIQDMYDLYRENGADGLLMAFPGVFGIGSQTYMDQIPLETKTATGKPTIEWRSQPSLGETIINKITGTKIKSVPVKETYDKVQQLLRDGKINEARNIVNGLSENEYALYKKFKEKDKRIANDELKAKIIPVYNDVKKLKEQNRIEEAKKIVNSLTDKEYEIYKKIKEEDYQSISD